jgi:hypothetical protein
MREGCSGIRFHARVHGFIRFNGKFPIQIPILSVIMEKPTHFLTKHLPDVVNFPVEWVRGKPSLAVQKTASGWGWFA